MAERQPSDVQAKSNPTVVQGGGGGVEGIPPSLSFSYVTVFRNAFALSEKPLIFSMR